MYTRTKHDNSDFQNKERKREQKREKQTSIVGMTSFYCLKDIQKGYIHDVKGTLRTL